MKLSDHFTLEELTFSEFAARNGFSNAPMPRILENMREVLVPGLEQVRSVLGVPMRITSGYRSEAVNAAVGGAAGSQHRYGLAADFVAPEFGDPYAVAKAIAASGIRFRQVILEFGRWVHVGFSPTNFDRELLTIYAPTKIYKAGILTPDEYASKA